MNIKFNKNRRVKYIIGLVLLLAAVAWAASQLSGQANAAAADAGANSLEMEKISLDMITEPKPKKNPPSCDWQEEKRMRKLIEENNTAYGDLVAKAKSESTNQEKVSSETASAVKDSATKYASLQENYAKMWDACSCKTRAKLSRELAESRIKNADVVANEINSDKIEAMQAQQEKLNQARQEYVEQAKNDEELTPEDKKEVAVKLIPRTKMVATNIAKLVQEVVGLMQQVQETASAAKGGSGMLSTGFKALKGLTEGNLFMPVKALLSLCKSMATSAEALLSDLQILSN